MNRLVFSDLEQQFSVLDSVMEAANHSENSAMEAENHVCFAKCKHVKHGAHSKSQMSRRYRKSFALFILLAGAIVSSTCTKDKDEDNNDVYVAGTEFGRAVLWKNGVAQYLTDRTDNWDDAYSVFVSGNDVYVVGVENSKAVLWKNGVAQYLSGGTHANSVFVSGSDVYVAGSRTWKNGKVLYNNGGNSVFVSGNDVYVAGGEDGKAVLWKNGVAQNLPHGIYSAGAASVFVSDDDVYAVGSEKMDTEVGWVYAPKLWINGVIQNLPSNYSSMAYSVFISGGDVYVSGWEPYGTPYGYAILWKNGEKQKLTNNYSSAGSVFVSGSDVYVALSEFDDNNTHFDAKIWKNGVLQTLSDGSIDAYANSVFVTK